MDLLKRFQAKKHTHRLHDRAGWTRRAMLFLLLTPLACLKREDNPLDLSRPPALWLLEASAVQGYAQYRYVNSDALEKYFTLCLDQSNCPSTLVGVQVLLPATTFSAFYYIPSGSYYAHCSNTAFGSGGFNSGITLFAKDNSYTVTGNGAACIISQP